MPVFIKNLACSLSLRLCCCLAQFFHVTPAKALRQWNNTRWSHVKDSLKSIFSVLSTVLSDPIVAVLCIVISCYQELLCMRSPRLSLLVSVPVVSALLSCGGETH